MATNQKNKDLLDANFTPIKVNLEMYGNGGEIYAGCVDRKIYEYFKKNEYDIEEYAVDSDGEWSDRVPEDMQPFYPEEDCDCDDLWHAAGATLDVANVIRVIDKNEEEIWTHNLDYNDLTNSGIEVEKSGSTYINDLDENTVVYLGMRGEEGCFFDAEFILRQPFDPKKLKISYKEYDEWTIISSVEYDGKELDGIDGYSTVGNWSEHKWVIVGDEEVYNSISIDDREANTGE